MGRKQLARRDVFYTSSGDHPNVVVYVLADRYVLASGTHADEATETTSIWVEGSTGPLMGLDRRRTSFFKMHVTIWNEIPPQESWVVGRCLPSLFSKLERMVDETVEEHALGQRAIKSLPRGSAVPIDLMSRIKSKK